MRCRLLMLGAAALASLVVLSSSARAGGCASCGGAMAPVLPSAQVLPAPQGGCCAPAVACCETVAPKKHCGGMKMLSGMRSRAGSMAGFTKKHHCRKAQATCCAYAPVCEMCGPIMPSAQFATPQGLSLQHP